MFFIFRIYFILILIRYFFITLSENFITYYLEIMYKKCEGIIMTSMIEILKNEHKNVKNLLNEAVENKDTSKYPQIQKELRIHLEGEETLLYPKTREQATDLTLEAYEEHDLVKKELNDLDNLNIENEYWMPKMKVVKDLVEHHVKEEEDEYFPKTEELLGSDQLDHLGQKYADWKDDVM